jgi:hypothetical protein
MHNRLPLRVTSTLWRHPPDVGSSFDTDRNNGHPAAAPFAERDAAAGRPARRDVPAGLDLGAIAPGIAISLVASTHRVAGLIGRLINSGKSGC